MAKSVSKSRLLTARVMSGLVILFMLFDSVMKFIKPAEVVEGTLSLGFEEHHIFIIGLLGLLSAILYLVPRTSILGAVLLTGYYGGVNRHTFANGCPALFSYTVSRISSCLGMGRTLAEG